VVSAKRVRREAVELDPDKRRILSWLLRRHLAGCGNSLLKTSET
jgi:hypothetical protein